MTPIEQKIWDIAAPIAGSQGVRVVRVQLSGKETQTLQIMLEPEATTPENRHSVTLEQCVAFSRELSVILDVEDPLPEAFNLEVSSTGLERPLVTLEDFATYAPHRVKLKTKNAIGGQKRFTGVLLEVKERNIIVHHEGAEQATEIPYEDVASAKLAFTPEEEKTLIGQSKSAS